MLMPRPAVCFRSPANDFLLLQGDCLEQLSLFKFQFDMIFADPPYFLSNGGISVQAGKQVKVDKGDWDKSKGFEADNKFNLDWLAACREKLTPNGTIWISGTFHNIGSVEQALKSLGYHVLNMVTWQKTNPPPNLSCRYFTYSTEFVLWARKDKKAHHYFDYDLMKAMNNGQQMRDVWRLPAIAPWEKSCGKHPTQKPLALLTRLILASTHEGDWVLDPFSGSSTTGIAANLFNRRYVGIEREKVYLDIAIARRRELEMTRLTADYRHRILSTLDTPTDLVRDVSADYDWRSPPF